MRTIAISVALLAGCSNTAVIHEDGAGGNGGGNAASTSVVTLASSGVGFDQVASSSTGAGGMVPWDNNCASTGFDIQLEAEPPRSLPQACSSWGRKHHDGPVAYEILANFQGALAFEACDSATRAFEMEIIDGPSTPDPIGWGWYDDGNSSWELSVGSLTIIADGDVGEVIEASFVVTLTSGDLSQQATGTFRACHIPFLGLPLPE